MSAPKKISNPTAASAPPESSKPTPASAPPESSSPHTPSAPTTGSNPPEASAPKKEDPDRKPDLGEMIIAVGDEVEVLEIIDSVMRRDYQTCLGGRDRRKLVVLRQVVRVLELVQANEKEFADLVREGRSRGRSGS